MKFVALMVVVELNSGLKNEICGKYGEDRRNCLVAGSGYIPGNTFDTETGKAWYELTGQVEERVAAHGPWQNDGLSARRCKARSTATPTRVYYRR